MTPGEHIKAIRKKKGETQEDFATRVGLSRLTISNIERGLRPSPRAAIKLKNATGKPLKFFYTEEPSVVAPV